MVKRYRPPDRRTKPNRKRLTEANVRNLPAKSKQYLVWDAGKDAACGLAVLVSPGPRRIKSYRCVWYEPSTNKRTGEPTIASCWKNLGRFGEVSLEEAREATRRIRGLAKKGEDPRADDPSRSDSFLSLAEDYVHHVQVGARGNLRAEETKRVILGHTKDWHARPVATIRPAEIERLLWRIRDGGEDRRGTPYMANRLYAHLRDVFKWAARASGPLKASPMADMDKPWKGEKARDLPWFSGQKADDALRKLWRAADDIGGVRGRYIKAMILTGKRSGAQAKMRWEEIDAGGFWQPPKSKAKNKRTNLTPLAPLALRVLGPRKPSGEVFEGVGDLKLLSGRVRKATGIEDFIWHGLRHLCETKTAELRDAKGRAAIPANVRDLLFDHAPPRGTGAVYDHHDYRAELSTAAQAWTDYVQGLVAAEGVAVLG